MQMHFLLSTMQSCPMFCLDREAFCLLTTGVMGAVQLLRCEGLLGHSLQPSRGARKSERPESSTRSSLVAKTDAFLL